MEERKDIVVTESEDVSSVAEETEEQKITDADISEIEETRKKYRTARNSIDFRIKENEIYWKLLHNMATKEDVENNTPKSASAWLFNSVANKHADAMDNYPEVNIFPREESDKETAEMLKKIIPVVLENCNFEETYDDCWWDKDKSGTAVYGVFWNNELMNGVGDIDIKQIDLLNIDWEPGIRNIQNSKNIFITAVAEVEVLEKLYNVDLQSTGLDNAIPEYPHGDNIDYSDKVAVTDWYYKKKVVYEDETGRKTIRNILHYCKYANGKVLFASENDPEYAERGWYDHGWYPVVFDIFYPEKDYPTGFGNIDIMKNPQLYIDKLNDVFLMNAEWGATPRYFGKEGSGLNMPDFKDKNNLIIEVPGNFNKDNLIRVETPNLDGNYLAVLNGKIEELKETSGNRDFSQGATSSGVTAYAAIAALMEAGSKLSRDTIKASYRAYCRIIYLVIELMRQFYDEPRVFRVLNNNEEYFVKFDNTELQEKDVIVEGKVIGTRLPIFDIKCTAQKASPFAKLSQNELAKELYNLGFFNPQMAEQAGAALDMMEFEGKDQVKKIVTNNGTMMQQIVMLQQQVMQLQQMLQGFSDVQGINIQNPNGESSKQPVVNALGNEIATSARMEEARERAASQATV